MDLLEITQLEGQRDYTHDEIFALRNTIAREPHLPVDAHDALARQLEGLEERLSEIQTKLDVKNRALISPKEN